MVMNNVVKIDKIQAMRNLEEHNKSVNKIDIRHTINTSLEKLNEVESRINKIENKKFFKRIIHSISGQNQRDMLSAMRDISQTQKGTIEIVLSLAVLNAENYDVLEEILEELKNAKGTYIGLADHIAYLYKQVDQIKLNTQKKVNSKRKIINKIKAITSYNKTLIWLMGVFAVLIVVFGLLSIANIF